jgi:hypothetical protein
MTENYPHIQTYYPIYQRTSRPHGKRIPIQVTRPVYPGYIFQRNTTDGIVTRLTTQFRVYAVRFGDTLATLPDSVILDLRRLESLNLLVQEKILYNPYYPGRKVRVHLPIADITAVIVRLISDNKALVDTSLCKITVGIHQLDVI